MKRLVIYCLVLAGVIVGSVAYSASSSADKSFLSEAVQSGAGEIGLANAAIERAQKPEVKSFAQQVVVEHTAVNEEIRSLAAGKGATLPPGMSVDQHIMVSELVETRDKEFDSKFMKRMVSNHERSVALYRKASTSDPDADVRAFAARTLPKLEGHLEMARNIRKQS